MIRIVACGTLKEKWMKEACQDYTKRIQNYEAIEVVEVEDEKASEKNSDAQNEMVKEKEGQRILKRIKEDEYVILLDLAGKPMDSIHLAQHLDQLPVYGHSRVTFVIGGSLGVSKALIARANLRWKLSDNTFPHQLCRIFVLEQIYRSFKIRRNEPYHK